MCPIFPLTEVLGKHNITAYTALGYITFRQMYSCLLVTFTLRAIGHIGDARLAFNQWIFCVALLACFHCIYCHTLEGHGV